MADTSADEFSQFPVESIARFLSVCGNEDPNLLRRSRASASAVALPGTATRRHVTNATQHESYIEELVSIAIASARQAEDAARQVHAANGSARRRTFAVSAVGAAGLLIGLAVIGSAGLGVPARWVQGAGNDASEMNGRHVAAAPAGPRIAVAHHDGTQVRVADVAPAAPLATPRDQGWAPPEPPLPAAPIKTADAVPDAARASAQPQSAEATPHTNANPVAPVADAPPPAVVASATPDPPAPPVFVAPRPVPPRSPPVETRPAPGRAVLAQVAPSGQARAHGAGVSATSPSRLVAALEALEALTDERPPLTVRGGQRLAPYNNRM